MTNVMLPPPPANLSALRLMSDAAYESAQGSATDACYALAAGHSLRRFSDFGPSIEQLAEAAFNCGE